MPNDREQQLQQRILEIEREIVRQNPPTGSEAYRTLEIQHQEARYELGETQSNTRNYQNRMYASAGSVGGIDRISFNQDAPSNFQVQYYQIAPTLGGRVINEEVVYDHLAAATINQEMQQELPASGNAIMRACHRCGGAHAIDSLTPSSQRPDRLYCEHCFSLVFPPCGVCGVITTHSGHLHCSCICASCTDSGHTICTQCSSLTTLSECEECNEGCGFYCPDCWGNHESGCNRRGINLIQYGKDLKRSGSSQIIDYHSKVNWIKTATDRDLADAPYLGLELEMQCSQGTEDDYTRADCNCPQCRTATSVNYSEGCYQHEEVIDRACRHVGECLAGQCVVSYDGSVPNGFELIITPTKRYALKNLKLHKLVRELATMGCSSHRSGKCGFHIHLSRNKWFQKEWKFRNKKYSNASLYQYFFAYLNAEIITFSKRNLGAINRYCAPRIGGIRYSMVNLSNSKTVEVRIWRGTLNPIRLQAYILFTLAALDFCKAHSPAVIMPGGARRIEKIFTDWLATRDEYQALTKYLKRYSLFGLGKKKNRTRPQDTQYPDTSFVPAKKQTSNLPTDSMFDAYQLRRQPTFGSIIMGASEEEITF